MHLTNYAINKHNENFVRDDATGSKRYSLVCSPLPLPLSPTVSTARESETGSREADCLGKLSLYRPLYCACPPSAAPTPPW